jgi:hypothetical protein
MRISYFKNDIHNNNEATGRVITVTIRIRKQNNLEI